MGIINTLTKITRGPAPRDPLTERTTKHEVSKQVDAAHFAKIAEDAKAKAGESLRAELKSIIDDRTKGLSVAALLPIIEKIAKEGDTLLNFHLPVVKLKGLTYDLRSALANDSNWLKYDGACSKVMAELNHLGFTTRLFTDRRDGEVITTISIRW